MLGPHIYAPREDGGDPRQCPSCGSGRLNLKAGKFGAFVGCSNYPECRYTRPLGNGAEGAPDRLLGQDPATGLEIAVKSGRFGPYIQLGEQKDVAEGEKPKRAGIPKGTNPADVDLPLALNLLSLPREVGRHPESGQPIKAGIGRFGPYVQHEKTYASLEAGDDVFSVGLNRAVTLIAEKVAKGPGRGRFKVDPGKVLGDHPSGGAIAAKNGRYGPYVTHNGTNATLPADITPDTVTLAQAIELIDARAGKGKPKRGKKTETQAGASAVEPAKPAPKEAARKPSKTVVDLKSVAKKAAKKSAAKARGTVTAKAAPADVKPAAKKAAGKRR
jgi:DNA topoisomerase-1